MKSIPKESNMINEICVAIGNLKSELALEINNAIIKNDWIVGKIITDNENNYNNRLEYGAEVLKELSKELTKFLGKGYSVSNLKYMRRFYEIEAIKNKWSKRELERQLDTSLFEWLLLSNGKANKEKVHELATKGQIISKPEDILKEPIVLEFLGLQENKPVLEKELEAKIIKHIEDFLLELGKGFMYYASSYTYYIPNKEQLIREVEKAISDEK